MKITFLTTSVDDAVGRLVRSHAHVVASVADVRILSLSGSPMGGEDADSLSYEVLLDHTNGVRRPTRPTSLSDDDCRSLTDQCSTQSGQNLDRLAELELDLALAVSDADLVVAPTPELMRAAAAFARSEVMIVGLVDGVAESRGDVEDPVLGVAPGLDALAVVSDWRRARMTEALGDAAPLSFGLPPVVSSGFRPRSATSNRVVVAHGPLLAASRFDDLVEAFSAAVKDVPVWSLRIFGDGPDRNKLKRLIDAIGRHDRIFVLDAPADMREVWSGAGLAAVTGGGDEPMTRVLDPWSAGVPVVAYAGAGPAELVGHRREGLVVGDGQVQMLAAALGDLMGDEVGRGALGEQALARARDYGPGHLLAGWRALLDGVSTLHDDPQRSARRVDRAAARAAVGGRSLLPRVGAQHRGEWRRDDRAQEDDFVRADPTLVRSGGRLAVESDNVLHQQASTDNLRRVVTAFSAVSVPHVVLPGQLSNQRVLVAQADRPAAIRALSEAWVDEPVYAELLSPRTERPGTVLLGSLPEDLDVKGLRVFRPVVTRSRTLRYGPGVGCDVEFWSVDPTGAGHVAPFSRTEMGRVLGSLEPDATTTVGDLQVPTRSEFTLRSTKVVDAPIDAVWTWVDDTDPAWQQRLESARLSRGIELTDRGNGAERYRNRDELRYSMRSVAMYAPWIRHHYLVTDDQVPGWLATDHPDITVVSHRDIFSDPGVLPTFNSHAIGSQLHHIDGLSEQFLVLNDDVFLGRPVARSTFFGANGAAKCFPSNTPIPLGEPHEGDGVLLLARKNARRLVEEAFGRTLTHGYLHTPHAVLRSLLFELEERYPQEWAVTAGAQFREPTDVTILSALHHEFGYLARRVERAHMKMAYVNTSRYDQQPQMTRLLALRNQDAFCLNDSSDGTVPAEEQALMVQAFLEAYFPVSSPFERL